VRVTSQRLCSCSALPRAASLLASGSRAQQEPMLRCALAARPTCECPHLQPGRVAEQRCSIGTRSVCVVPAVSREKASCGSSTAVLVVGYM
jgi:hypothetical protein